MSNKSHWFRGLLYAESKTKNLLRQSTPKTTIISELYHLLCAERNEFWAEEDWIDGVESYIKHYEERLL